MTKVGVYANNSLESFLDGWKLPRHAHPNEVKALGWSAGVLPGATTDADGRFAIAGAGSERLVTLCVRGPGIAESELRVVNRDGLDLKPYNQLVFEGMEKVRKVADPKNLRNGDGRPGEPWVGVGIKVLEIRPDTEVFTHDVLLPRVP